MAHRRDIAIRKQREDYLVVFRFPKEDRFVHVENGVAIAILRQGKGWLSRLYNLADLEVARGNHARGIRPAVEV